MQSLHVRTVTAMASNKATMMSATAALAGAPRCRITSLRGRCCEMTSCMCRHVRRADAGQGRRGSLRARHAICDFWGPGTGQSMGIGV